MIDYEFEYLLLQVENRGYPESPLLLPQEMVGGEDEDEHSWRVVLASMILNDEAIWKFLIDWPRAHNVAFAPSDAHRRMARYLRPLGSHHKRTKEIVEMSRQWIMGLRPPEIDGNSQYVIDAYRIFVENQINVAPQDAKLARYVSWRHIENSRAHRSGITG